jgi:hypothetical protein
LIRDQIDQELVKHVVFDFDALNCSASYAAADAIAELCSDGCTLAQETRLVMHLHAELPSPRIVRSLVRALRVSTKQPPRAYGLDERDSDLRTPPEQLRHEVVEALGSLGEVDLELVAQEVSDDAPATRHALVSVIEVAIEIAPLRSVKLETLLARWSKSDDTELAASSKRVLSKYRSQPNVDWRRFEGTASSSALHFLTLRRLSCGSARAEEALRAFTNDKDLYLAREAIHALRFRRARCREDSREIRLSSTDGEVRAQE